MDVQPFPVDPMAMAEHAVAVSPAVGVPVPGAVVVDVAIVVMAVLSPVVVVVVVGMGMRMVVVEVVVAVGMRMIGFVVVVGREVASHGGAHGRQRPRWWALRRRQSSGADQLQEQPAAEPEDERGRARLEPAVHAERERRRDHEGHAAEDEHAQRV